MLRLTTTETVEKYKDTLFRIAFHICRCEADADDAVQECFCKYHTVRMEYESEEHLKAWLIRVTINFARNIATSFWRRNREGWEEYMAEMPFEEPGDSDVFEAVMTLPARYRLVIHLFYYEEYSVKEIAEILETPVNTVKSRLSRGRKLLKKKLKEEWQDEQ